MPDGDLIPRGSAAISDCGVYRYNLVRWMNPVGFRRRVTFIMLNPSTADGEQDDPTIRRCMGFAKSWMCGTLIVLNLFAYRATSPADMRNAADPVGPDNQKHFKHWLGDTFDFLEARHDLVVCAWGAHGSYRDQDRTVMGWLSDWHAEPQCLGVTKDGHPKHPLYLKSDCKLVPYAGRSR
jgi:hypothetical protein